MAGVDQFMQHVRPRIVDDADAISGALIALLEKTGPAVLVTHSASGLWGWLAAARSPNVKAIVSYEPGFVFPKGEVRPPVPLSKGLQESGPEITAEEFANLSKIPVQVVYGDNIPTDPANDLPADGRRAQIVSANDFVAALNKRGGRASVLHLPSVGLYGNSHFMYSDLNNIQVADQLSAFLEKHGLEVQ